MSSESATPAKGDALPRRQKQLLALVFIVFLSGFLTGTLSRRLTSAILGAPQAEVPGANRHFIEEFSSHYGLDRDQRLRLRIILESRDHEKLRILDELRRARSGEERNRLLGDVLEANRLADRRIPKILNRKQRDRYTADLDKQD